MVGVRRTYNGTRVMDPGMDTFWVVQFPAVAYISPLVAILHCHCKCAYQKAQRKLPDDKKAMFIPVSLPGQHLLLVVF